MILGNGLWGHIRWNTLKSGLLLAGFVVLLAIYWFGLCLAFSAVLAPFEARSNHGSVETALYLIAASASQRTLATWYVPVTLMVVWYAVAWRWHRRMISAATGAVHVERRKAPKLYNAVENLAISAGLPMPRIEIMETPELNAYAAGLTPDTATIAVTRGLLNTLTPAELEAVLAHEMAHIKNRDVRLMVVALIFAGPITFLGGLLKSWWQSNTSASYDGWDILWFLGRRRHSEGSSWEVVGDDESAVSAAAGFAAFVAGVIGLIIALLTLGATHISAVFSRFGISRAREFMADAGAVELTKNPDALISALSKISGRDHVPLASESLRAMMFSCAFDDQSFVDSLMATHPPMNDRITSLVDYAGGRMMPERTATARSTSPRTAPVWSKPASATRQTAILSPATGATGSPWGRPSALVPEPVAVAAASSDSEIRPNFGRRVRQPKVGLQVSRYATTA
jgi:heat shock protein HtpX